MTEPFHPDGHAAARGDEYDDEAPTQMTPAEVEAEMDREAYLRARPGAPMLLPTEPDGPFTHEQTTRVEALRVARDIVIKRGSPLFGSTEVTIGVADLVDVAQYIVDGTHPMARYDGAPGEDIETVEVVDV